MRRPRGSVTRRHSKSLDSLEWSRKFEVLSISRKDLTALRFSTRQINRLTDNDMWTIVDDLRNGMESAFDEDFTTAVSYMLYGVLPTEEELPTEGDQHE